MGPIETWLAKKALDSAYSASKQILSTVGARLISTSEDLESAIAQHTQEINVWCSEISFADLKRPKATSHVYLHLDCYLTPRSRRMATNEPLEKRSFSELFSGTTAHFVILGTPGAGKTTSMKSLCQRVLHESDFAANRYNIPVLIRLRDLNRPKHTDATLSEEIASILGIKLEGAEILSKTANRIARERLNVTLTASVLDEFKALVILDGFDEIADYEKRESVIQEIRALSLKLTSASLVITSRTGEFNVHIEGAGLFELCPLSSDQILTFATKWLGNYGEAVTFLEQVRKSPFADSAIKPLTLAHLCAIYERINSIPDKPRSVYRKILRLLIEDWDEQRSVRRKSRYAQFEADRKYDFLANFAYELTLESSSLTFPGNMIEAIYRDIGANFALPKSEARRVAEELEGHTGLFIQSGFEEYEFAHKSLQEFLAAEFLVRLPSIPSDRETLCRLPNELAIAVTISSDPSKYFVELVLGRFRNLTNVAGFFSVFATRLLQEKPDFTSNDTVILALLVLYSYSLSGASKQHPEQLNLFIFDEAINQFEELMNLCAERNPKFRVSKYFEVTASAHVVGNDNYHSLKRIAHHSTYRLPDHIYMRERFVNEAKMISGSTTTTKP